ncbi:hypothetical protein F7725_021024 [Dissostichus mawsoni]|uniref:Tubulin delta chain n=1 Tax=Dissostichus mawsoni TaxID=36200 RepID=A0A7J5YEU9_DISMA|nr:hypothetical protein F7725_021024 [Dissostichus mawsoni]
MIVCSSPPIYISQSELNSEPHSRELQHVSANVLILRGKDVYSAETGGFEDPALYSSWLSPQEAFSVWKSPVPFNKYEKSATLVSNSQALLRPLDSMVGGAWNMFASRAYIHQYTKFGISEEDFLDSFSSLEQVISSDKQLR